jgi:hypothetical protein
VTDLNGDGLPDVAMGFGAPAKIQTLLNQTRSVPEPGIGRALGEEPRHDRRRPRLRCAPVAVHRQKRSTAIARTAV